MNTLLTQYVRQEEGKTRAESTKAYETAWESSKYLLTPLKIALRKRLEGLESVKETDFEIPNHYALLMFEAGRKEEIKLLLSLLPKGLED
jgi:hypothetical protein